MIIGTCDKYHVFWENFMILCDRYWETDCRKIWVSETKKVPSSTYETHLPGANMAWSDRMRSVLDVIDTKYVFTMLDDFYLTTPISEERIDKYIQFLEEKDANKMMIAPYDRPSFYILHKHVFGNNSLMPEVKLDGDIHRLDNYSDYQTAIMPSVWRKDFLKEILVPNWNPWEVEISGTNRIKGRDNRVYMDKVEYPGVAMGIVRKAGNMIPGWEKIFEKENLTKPLVENNKIVL